MLSIPLLLFPLLGILIIWFPSKSLSTFSNGGDSVTLIDLRPSLIRSPHYFPLLLSIFNLVHTFLLMFLHQSTTGGFQFQLVLFDRLIAGIDGISLWLILLVNIIIPIVILNSWNRRSEISGGSSCSSSNQKDLQDSQSSSHSREFFLTLILLINFLSILVFIVLDLLLFYISFEAILIPMYFLINYYGSRNKKIEASSYFFLYTLFGSLFLLLSILTLCIQSGTSDYEVLLTLPISTSQQYLLWFGFFIALAIKMPMIPFHSWLPLTHTEAPTEGSVILAAILLKLGTYGFLRFSIPLFPEATAYFSPLVSVIAIISVLYSCLAALSLIDLKQIIAYSSIAHQNIAMIGLFSNDFNGLSGAFLYSMSHGFVSAGLFLLVGFLYDRYHTRTLKYYRGLVLIIPIYTLLFFLFTLANISFPGTLGFIAEMFIYISSLTLSPFVLLLVSLVSILLPVYTIWTYHKIAYGALSAYISTIYEDITLKEFHLVFPLFFLTIFYGLRPDLMLSSVELPL